MDQPEFLADDQSAKIRNDLPGGNVSPVQDANISDPSLAACHKAIPGNVSLVIAITGHRDLNRDDYKELDE